MSLFNFKLFPVLLRCSPLFHFPSVFRKSLFHKKPCYWCLWSMGEKCLHGAKSIAQRRPQMQQQEGQQGEKSLQQKLRAEEDRNIQTIFPHLRSIPSLMRASLLLDVRGKVTLETWSIWGHSSYTKEKFNSIRQVFLCILSIFGASVKTFRSLIFHLGNVS